MLIYRVNFKLRSDGLRFKTEKNDTRYGNIHLYCHSNKSEVHFYLSIIQCKSLVHLSF